jgi:hypothetical protein
MVDVYQFRHEEQFLWVPGDITADRNILQA